MSTMRWSEPSLPEEGGIGSTPTIKNHSVTYYRGLLYCFGGYDGRRNNQTLLIYSLREGKWIAPADPNGFGGRGLIGSSNNASTTRHDIMFGGQYHVPPGRNGHTATLATNRRSRSLRARRNNNHNNDFQQEQQQQQQQAGDGMDDYFSDAGENLQGGDVMPNLPVNNGGESSMETDNNDNDDDDDDDDDDDEEAQIIIIGGWLGSGPLAASDTWVLDVSGGIDRLRWFSPPVRGTPPGPCNMHSSDFIPSKGEVYVFRGGNGREYLNDLHALDTTTYVWRTVETTGEAPQQRANHASAVLEFNGTTELYVFGGWNGSERLNDVHILDTETSTWSTPRISGSRPHPRAGMSLTALRGRLYLFGGSGTSSKCFDDLQIFDRKEMAWLDVNEEEQQHSSNQSSPSRYDNTERDVYPSWGGLSGQDGMMDGDRNNNRDSMFTDWRSQEGMYSHQSHSVNPNDEEMVASVLVLGKPPGKRAGHTATAVGRHIYVFGGSCGTDYLNDFFVLDTDPPPLMKLTESTCPDLVARRLKYFYNEEEFADVIFLVEGREVYGHKLVLSSVSDCFRAMFMGQFKESGSGYTRIDIPNCTYSSFIALMQYIYTGRAPELDMSSALDKAISLLELADQFFLYNLKQICEKELCECVSAETFAFLLQIAQKTNASQLESYCRYFERNHQHEMNNF